MKNLQIETGKQQYNLSDKVTVEFSPTDMDFIEQLVSVFRKAESQQKETEDELKSADAATVFDVAHRRNAEMRELVNTVFGTDICTPLFGSMNVFARANGMPLWANVLLTVLDECYDNLPQEDKATKARIDKYTKKYQKK